MTFWQGFRHAFTFVHVSSEALGFATGVVVSLFLVWVMVMVIMLTVVYIHGRWVQRIRK